jgi:hypothetical protein
MGGLIGVIILVLIFSIILPFISFDTNSPYIHQTPFSYKQVIEDNNLISERYKTEISPKGNEIIQSEIENISKIEDPNEKLDKIFKWEMHDWHNPNWELGTFWTNSYSPVYSRYKNDTKKIRINLNYEYSIFRPHTENGILYADDPNWLAYNKVGACRELSNLFSYMAQKSGFETRLVRTAWDHQWAEVKIDGEWRYYDPWCAVEHGYYNATDGNLTFKYKWFNKIENFRDNCHGGAYLNSYVEDPVVTWYNVFPNINFINENPVINFYFKNPMVYWYFYNPILHYRASLVYTYSYFWHDYKNIGDFFLYRI